eukprot:gnl/MRDRNA2_/MRDRNA2_72891_c0_seq1.p1 gnl/MRDRNA2_/MRDRNA2_72891_c0~~gnl/MRDRNA2_/MRDRNA2_72891_c0_seq1.p1  ORF type:complete len:500 (+),score=80.34 gnl/MRDRNA2_/MRDRNA2_72891_c0_seq1:86-1585(+)
MENRIETQTPFKKGCVIRFLSDSCENKFGVITKVMGRCAQVKVMGFPDQWVDFSGIELVTCDLNQYCDGHLDLLFEHIEFDCMQKLLLDPAHPKIKVIPVAGKGMGVVATQNLLKGERILEDHPFFIFDRCDATSLPKSMPAESTFWDLADITVGTAESDKTIPGIVKTNAYPIGTDGQGALFPVLSRFNHSCRPNVFHCWSPEHEYQALHAVTDIQMGEELTVAYDELLASKQVRQKILFDNFSFTCSCDVCRLTGEAERQSEANRKRLSELNQVMVTLEGAQEHVKLAQEAIRLIDDEFMGRPSFKVVHYRRSSLAYYACEKYELASFMAFKDYEANCHTYGPQSEYSKKVKQRMIALMQYPAMKSFRESKRLGTSKSALLSSPGEALQSRAAEATKETKSPTRRWSNRVGHVSQEGGVEILDTNTASSLQKTNSTENTLSFEHATRKSCNTTGDKDVSNDAKSCANVQAKNAMVISPESEALNQGTITINCLDDLD